MRIENQMSAGRFNCYKVSLDKQLSVAVHSLEPTWEHAACVRAILEETSAELQDLSAQVDGQQSKDVLEPHERKIEKYTTWIEVMRLASFQYGRYNSLHHSVTEGLYSTLLALASQYCRNLAGKTIAVLGCGPGRSVLDFALAYPTASVIGMDYSLLSLVMAKHILGEQQESLKVPVRDTTDEHLSKLVSIPCFSLKNCRLCLCDLTEQQQIRADLVVCSNTINLLPDHNRAIDIVADMLHPGGILLFADLIGWRLDRQEKQTVLRSSEAIAECFSAHGIQRLEQFTGGPYIEQETPENYTIFHEHFYVGKKNCNEEYHNCW